MELYRARVLVVDDEESMRYLIGEVMTREGYEVDTAANGLEAVQKVREADYDLVIMDIKMPHMDGMQALREMRRIRPRLTVVMITAFGSNQIAVEAIREGAYDFFNKPFEVDEMRTVVRRALEKQHLVRQIAALQNRLVERFAFDRIIGQSDAMRAMFLIMEKVITNDVTVLVTGESGTGKELVAQAIHYNSQRKTKPFISVNCAAIPETLLESELFGHEKGSFTGALATKAGRFEAANGGSIFLDEIGDMPPSLQSKLLRVVQEREIQRIGSNRSIKVDIRVIAATNRNLARCVEEKSFREDLFFRLNVLPIHLPPLRSRRSDIPLLVDHLIGVHGPKLNKGIQGTTAEVMQIFTDYDWPGNVRELENVIQRAMVLATGTLIDVGELPEPMRSSPARRVRADAGSAFDEAQLHDFSVPLQKKLERITEEIEKKIIVAALQKAGFRRKHTAELLGMSRKSLHNKMVKYQLFTGREDSDSED